MAALAYYLMNKNQNALAAAILAGVWSLFEYLKIITTKMVITNRRIIYKEGILSVRTEELKNNKVEAIEIEQSIAGTIFGYATICFSGIGTSTVKFYTVAHPYRVKTQIEEYIAGQFR